MISEGTSVNMCMEFEYASVTLPDRMHRGVFYQHPSTVACSAAFLSISHAQVKQTSPSV